MFPELDRSFGLIVFDWDGTAVPDRQADATALRDRIRSLLERGVAVVIVSGTHLGNITGQLRIAGLPLPRGRLYATLNRGSEVFAFDAAGHPERIYRRRSSPDEDRQLDRIAERLRQALMDLTGLPVAIISNRLNRRKVDLIPLPEWADPPKARMADLLQAVTRRYDQGGVPDPLGRAIGLARQFAVEEGLADARLTTDVKHVEIGLTDKADSMAWIMRVLAPTLGVPPEGVLIAGDEFGPLAGFPGSDSRMRVPESEPATFVSVGPEPNGVPPGILHLGGGPDRFLALLSEQAERAHPAPPTTFIPSLRENGCLFEDGWNATSEHEIESRFALSNGYSGTRAALMEGSAWSRPGTLLAGVFDTGQAGFPELVLGPLWSGLDLEVEGEALRLDTGDLVAQRRILDMERGMLLRVWRHRTPEGRITRVHEARWASLADPHLFCQWLWLMPENYAGTLTLTTRLDARIRDLEGEAHLVPVQEAPCRLVAMTRRSGIVIAAACRNVPHLPGQDRFEPGLSTTRFSVPRDMNEALDLRRTVALYTSREHVDPSLGALKHLEALGSGMEALAEAHVAAWRARWQEAEIRIEGDDAAQRALNFALYHLIGSANPADPTVSLGARALTGEGYKGHVFWDTEIFMLPFYTHTCPPAARSLLMYRYHTLDQARQRAQNCGYRGALFAWESADTGADVTPRSVMGLDGAEIPVMTGPMAHHISADVAYAVWQYWLATGDEGFMREAGAEILLEVARFWASRAEPDASGTFHLRHVVGPDEYHEVVDDNAYTNELARWCLERGQEVAGWLEGDPGGWKVRRERLGVEAREAETWGAIAARLADCLSPERGMHEQFAGYFQLEDIDLAGYSSRTVPMDVLLGHSRITRSQIIKQADVVMLLHLLWERFAPEVRARDFAYYEARTGHGSSLSPGAHALVAARLHDPATAMRYFRFAGAIDLDNRMGNASEGIHAAALGCLWQVVTFGFMGLHVRADALSVDPVPPEDWRSLEVPFQYHGVHLRFILRRGELAIEVSGSVPVLLCDNPPRVLSSGRWLARLEQGAWRWMDAS